MLRKIVRWHSLVLLLLAPITLSAVLSLTLTQANGQQDEGPPEVQITEERLSGYRDFNCDQIKKELTAVAERYEYEATPKMTDGSLFFGGNVGYIIAIKELSKVAGGKACKDRSFDCSKHPLTCEAVVDDARNAYNNGDYTTALREVKPVAEQGLSEAQVLLGVIYELGQGVAQDFSIAVEWYHRAAEQGDATAQRNLGNKYYHGEGVALSYPEAAKWYLKSAEQGHPESQHNLGFLYANGQGVPQDFVAARKWWLKAATSGHMESKRNLGLIYLQGLGTPPDMLQAYMWFEIAIAAGDEASKEGLAEAAKSLTSAQVEEAKKMAREWEQKHPVK